MPAVQKSLRIPTETLKEIDQMSKETGKDFSSVTNDLLSEALRMRQCPGIVFAEGVSGRRSRVAGTGIEVWEIIANYLSLEKDFNHLKKTYHWIKPEQLKAALGYYSSYPEEIDRLIEKNESWSVEKIKERHPLMSGSK
ncbi:MAG: DUF433 domain-containing protein [Deltaproteobacteria bacterium]|nr:DUF433 domain-containing protein [Deltaproteobacteria bacterium]